MDLGEELELFYNENISITSYGTYDGGECEVEELKVTKDEFKKKLEILMYKLTDKLHSKML